MSGENMEGAAAVGHLLRRAGFGATPGDLDEYRSVGYRKSLQKLLDELDQPTPADPAGFDPYEPGAIQQLWLDRMRSGHTMLGEKLALFWHGHFANSNAKVQDAQLMWSQYRLFRTHGAGRFRQLVEKVSRDVAMIRFLDGNSNRKGIANENYGRELQELFTLGIGNYTEKDIREIARAFTGFGCRHHEFVYSPEFHDDGQKTVHGQTGNFDGDAVVGIITSLPACHRFIAGKLLRFFSHANPTDNEIAELAKVLEKTGGDIRSTLFVLFHSPAFLSHAHHRVLIKSPVEFVISARRATGAAGIPPWCHGALERMGQILFRPPSVKGWTSGTGWLSAAGVVERFKAAHRFAQEAAPEVADSILDTAFDGSVPEAMAQKLAAANGRDRIALALASPEFQLA